MIRRNIVAFLIIAAVGGLLYGNILNAPFQLDDNDLILDNPAYKNIHDVRALWDYTPRKFITSVTFSLNYALAKHDPYGYHLVNVLLHIMTAFLVWRLFSVLCALPILKGRIAHKDGVILSMFGALIFLAHPLQTESVTYIWQRSTVLSGVFFFSAILMYLKGRISGRSLYFAASAFTFLIGFFAKGDVVALPLTIILLEACFFRDPAAKVRKILFMVLPVLALVLILMAFNLENINKWMKNAAFFSGTADIGRLTYMLTQLRVITRYLSLLFIPLGQNVDHYFTLSRSLFEPACFLSFLSIVLIVLLAVRLFRPNRIASFGIFFFLISLIPTSSVFPLRTVIFEHRLYIPMAGFSVFLSSILCGVVSDRRIRHIVMILILLAFGYLTVARNTLWCSETALLEDAVNKAPLNARPQLMLGAVYYKHGESEKAEKAFERAIFLAPDYPDPYNDLGLIYLDRGDLDKAGSLFNRAIHLRKDFVDPYINLVHVLVPRGDYDGAMTILKKSLEYKLSDKAYSNLGNIYIIKNMEKDAETAFREAIAINPESYIAWYNLANIYAARKDYAKAVEFYRSALRIKPDFPEANNNLAKCLSYLEEARK